MEAYKNKYCRLLLIGGAIVFLAACHNYYQAVQKPSGNSNEKATTIDSLKFQNRYFVLRNGSQSYYINNMVLSEDKKTLTCSLETLPANHQFHLVKGRRGKMQYQKNNPEDLTVLNEVHFYIQPDNTAALGQYTLQLDKVEKIEVIEKDKKRTTSSYVIGAIGYTLGAVAVVGIIALATKSSCPFVSAYDGTDFSLQGEIYGGAIYPQLARHDYMPLRMAPLSNGSLQLKISNELHEHQYTDMAELWVITHDKNSKVFADENGNLFSVTAPQPPILASLNTKTNAIAPLQKAGDNNLLYMDDTAVSATNEVILQFNKPATAKKAKLLLSLKNSYFLDLLYGELAKGFGSYYNTYIKQQRKKPVAELLKWTKEQQIPMEVSVKTNNGWKKITDLTTIGPLATRDIVIPIELPESGETITAIKLSSGFMFWEIDYAAIDYSAENNFSVQKITPSKATDELGRNVLPDLQKEDAVYFAQPDIGNVATMIYAAAPLNDNLQTRTYILHTKGYYEHVRNFKNSPNVSFLNEFKKPNAFPLFGMQLYKKINSDNLKTLAKSN
jgi:hypothetical protein